MRIRTIKPEFWQSRTLAGVSPFSRLLAIALLNWADDEGWFKADPALIRGSLFPFEDDSETVRGAVAELSRIGFIRVAEQSRNGAVGIIVNFRKHQRISKPQTSRLAIPELFRDCSATVPGTVAVGNGTGNREDGSGRGVEGEGNPPSPFPESSPSALPDSREVDPQSVEDPGITPKKEEGRGGDPPDLIEYLGMAESHAKGNPDGFSIPPAFVRHWHDIRTAGGWEKTSGQPVPNTVEARFADLKVMARAEHHQGRLQSYANGAATPAQKKKEAASDEPEPEGDWKRFARESLGFEPASEWEKLSPRLKKEITAAWMAEKNREQGGES